MASQKLPGTGEVRRRQKRRETAKANKLNTKSAKRQRQRATEKGELRSDTSRGRRSIDRKAKFAANQITPASTPPQQ
jgi:hypothetical protein